MFPQLANIAKLAILGIVVRRHAHWSTSELHVDFPLGSSSIIFVAKGTKRVTANYDTLEEFTLANHGFSEVIEEGQYLIVLALFWHTALNKIPCISVNLGVPGVVGVVPEFDWKCVDRAVALFSRIPVAMSADLLPEIVEENILFVSRALRGLRMLAGSQVASVKFLDAQKNDTLRLALGFYLKGGPYELRSNDRATKRYLAEGSLSRQGQSGKVRVTHQVTFENDDGNKR
ncbi:hypothetical protein BJ742DRAFT_744474 [Cladochytrium replicatum]|nr:hypothetical protein BJ742DRAFT_744474 [Cladochytrium replicatum]